ncbi:hypothetical protein SeMB42_g02456 [Synchytrium endobioticum]|uniref:J domain-containing protein n=1 Tax=Synchytrium endobioticum TaxID=286115 RepID=A0A507DE32_9FUNG|nr:hypothetical protein SeMB42_g02456 [Synchytrium endobioticum]
MNEEEAVRCLALAKKAFESEHDVAKAMRFLEFLENLTKRNGSTTTNGHTNGHSESEARKRRPFASSTNDTSSTSDEQAPPSTSSQRTNSTSGTANSNSSSTASSSSGGKSYTKDQLDGIKRIKACREKGDLYAVLGLKNGECSDDDIKKAYRKLALQYHPDKCQASGSDEAFKAIGNAYLILSDPQKRERYDRYGIDSDSRSAAAASPAHMQNHFHSQNFDSEISAEDIFNMFFGEMAGNSIGVRSYTFSSGSLFGQPRYHSNRFAHQRRYHESGGQHNTGPPTRMALLLQFLPLIALFVFSVVGQLMSYSSSGYSAENMFSMMKTPLYSAERVTTHHSVHYFVNPKLWSLWEQQILGPNPTGIKNREWQKRILEVEELVEYHHLRNLQTKCAHEKEYQRQKILQARGLFRTDAVRLKEASEMRLPNCEALRAFR